MRSRVVGGPAACQPPPATHHRGTQFSHKVAAFSFAAAFPCSLSRGKHLAQRRLYTSGSSLLVDSRALGEEPKRHPHVDTAVAKSTAGGPSSTSWTTPSAEVTVSRAVVGGGPAEVIASTAKASTISGSTLIERSAVFSSSSFSSSPHSTALNPGPSPRPSPRFPQPFRRGPGSFSRAWPTTLPAPDGRLGRSP